MKATNQQKNIFDKSIYNRCNDKDAYKARLSTMILLKKNQDGFEKIAWAPNKRKTELARLFFKGIKYLSNSVSHMVIT